MKPGEIDPNPETKPARPDPIDMDEDELEMLSEARARLANTQGKKAKRKAREKQLEEARRLAALQKRRELKAAGIGVRRHGKKRRGVDYNHEIPFEKVPAIGFYNTEEEVIDKEAETFKRIRQDNFDNQQKEREKKDKNKRKESEVTAEILNENKLEPTRKRTKLVLPTPQISDQELEEVVKLGQASEYARQQVEESGTPFTGQLLENYTVTPDISKLRTPMLASNQDTVLTEAQNLMALTVVETPLKGGLNTPLHESDFTSTTPQHKIPQTPNTMFQTPFRTPAGEVHATPVRATPGTLPTQTPIRDKLSINPEDGLYYDDKLKQKELKDQLRKGLSRLPAPKNDFEVIAQDDEDVESEANDKTEKMETDFIEDQADIDDKTRVQRKKREEEEMRRRSQSVQRNLPRPVDVNNTILRPSDLATPLTELQKAEELIKKEMLVMIHYDSMQTPTMSQCGLSNNFKRSFNFTPQPVNYDKNKAFLIENKYEQFSEEEINQVKHIIRIVNDKKNKIFIYSFKAKDLLEKEVSIVKKTMNHGDLAIEAYSQVWDECYSQVLFLPNSNRFTRASVASRKDKIDSLEKRLEVNRNHISKEAKKAGKLEKKLKVLFGGYESRANSLKKSFEETINQIESAFVEFLTFENIREREMSAIPRRIEVNIQILFFFIKSR